MMKTLTILLLFCCTSFLYSTDYFVSLVGSDASGDGTINNPYKTVAKALTVYVSGAGGTIYLRSGTYTEMVFINKSGNLTTPLTVKPYNNETVIFDGASVDFSVFCGGMIHVWNQTPSTLVEYVVLSGIKVQNALDLPNDPSGIYVRHASNIIVENNVINHVTSSGILVMGQYTGEPTSDITVRNNKIINANDGGNNENISLAGVDRFWVHGNELYEQGTINHTGGGEGIDAKQGSRNGYIYDNYIHDHFKVAIYIDAWNKHTYNIEIYNNVIADIADSHGIAVASENTGEVDNIIIHNNVIYNVAQTNMGGIQIETVNNLGTVNLRPIHNISILNNTISNVHNGIMISEKHTTRKNFENIFIANNLIDKIGTNGYFLGTRNTEFVTRTNGAVGNEFNESAYYTAADFTIANNGMRPYKNAGWASYSDFRNTAKGAVQLNGTTSLITQLPTNTLLLATTMTDLENKGKYTLAEIKSKILGFSDIDNIIPTAEKTIFLNNFETHFATDFNGNSRISGAGIDIGAYEKQLSTGNNFVQENQIVHLYPNPSNGVFYIDMKEHQDGEVKIFSTHGKLIYKETFLNKPIIKMDMKTKGAYLLCVTTKNKIYNTKLIIR